jgi:tRNA threonylcarbamoyl adenosine modification protein YeaZ
MATVYIERSTGDCRDGNWIESLDLSVPPARIVVGTGPGSFAGIRAALAFAQGYAIGSGCEVLGLPSACAVAAQTFQNLAGAGPDAAGPLAVVGDARRGKFWVALFDGYALTEDVFLAAREDLPVRLPPPYRVTTPDAARIDSVLRDLFGARYLGGRTPTADGLKAFADANPSVLTPEPLPLYLNPAVRDNAG